MRPSFSTEVHTRGEGPTSHRYRRPAAYWGNDEAGRIRAAMDAFMSPPRTRAVIAAENMVIAAEKALAAACDLLDAALDESASRTSWDE